MIFFFKHYEKENEMVPEELFDISRIEIVEWLCM